MGVYIFTWSKLRKYLIDDENNPESSNDFGHDVIPAMHAAGEKLYAYLLTATGRTSEQSILFGKQTLTF